VDRAQTTTITSTATTSQEQEEEGEDEGDETSEAASGEVTDYAGSNEVLEDLGRWCCQIQAVTNINL
jgi:hypothetical protein